MRQVARKCSPRRRQVWAGLGGPLGQSGAPLAALPTPAALAHSALARVDVLALHSGALRAGMSAANRTVRAQRRAWEAAGARVSLRARSRSPSARCAVR